MLAPSPLAVVVVLLLFLVLALALALVESSLPTRGASLILEFTTAVVAGWVLSMPTGAGWDRQGYIRVECRHVGPVR